MSYRPVVLPPLALEPSVVDPGALLRPPSCVAYLHQAREEAE
jgi:hypothetical protein